MTDNEYVSRIYCLVFQLESADDAMYAPGIWDAVNTLTEREQHALEYYYRDGLTYEKTATELGLSSSRTHEIVGQALRKLRHPSRLSKMRKR